MKRIILICDDEKNIREGLALAMFVPPNVVCNVSVLYGTSKQYTQSKRKGQQNRFVVRKYFSV